MNSKAKGNIFERKMANLLSARFASATGLANAFRRNPDSGSFFGGLNQRKVETHDLGKACFGDLICPASFAYSIECKHYKLAPSFASIVSGKVTEWDKWISQARQDSGNSGKRMAIIVKYNNVREIVIVDELPQGGSAIVTYGDSFVVTLDTFLSPGDSNFFPGMAARCP